jgi:hypothetical protein
MRSPPIWLESGTDIVRAYGAAYRNHANRTVSAVKAPAAPPSDCISATSGDIAPQVGSLLDREESGKIIASRIVHDLRRTAIRNLVRTGVPERVAMTMTGHKTRSVFERYSITSEGALDRAADQLEARLELERGRLAAGHDSGTINPLLVSQK